MSEAPERIWAEDVGNYLCGLWGVDREESHDVEYIRADIHEARIKELEARLAAQERIAETPVGETFIDTISDFAWADPYGPMFIALGKLKENKTNE